MLEIAAIFCLGILGAWFLLRIGIAETILALIFLGVAAAASYWLSTGSSGAEIARRVGIFALLVIVLGSIRVGVEKLSDMLAALLPPPLGTKGAGEHHPHVLRR